MANAQIPGLYVLAFAARYPGQVAGLVLVDSTAPASSSTPPGDAGSYSLLGRISAVLPMLARAGGTRLTCFSAYAGLPPQSRDEERASCSTARDAASTIDELRESATAMAQANAVSDLAGTPLAVVTAGSGHDAAWLSAQNELAGLSTNSVHRIVAGATHASLLEDENDAAASSQAIRDVLVSVRTGHPLPRR